MFVLQQVWPTSDTYEMPKGFRGHVENLYFTTILSIRHALFVLKIARQRWKFAFYHNFECPTLGFCVKGRGAT